MSGKLKLVGLVLAAVGGAGLLYPMFVGDIWPSLWKAAVASFAIGLLCLVAAVLRPAVMHEPVEPRPH